MSKISINIMAHPKRKKYIPYLKKMLGNVPVIWDKHNDVWETRKRCMEAHIKKGKKWSLTIQDDCLITDDFIAKAESFIDKHDRKLITRAFNFYFWNNSEQQVLRARRHGYFKKLGMKSGLAICLPTDMLPKIIEMWEGKEELYRHDDSRIGVYLRKRRIKTVYPCPSLIQHRDSPSLIYDKSEVGERKSICYEQ